MGSSRGSKVARGTLPTASVCYLELYSLTSLVGAQAEPSEP